VNQLKREHMDEVIAILNQVLGYTSQDRRAFLIMALHDTNAFEQVGYLDYPPAVFTPLLVNTMLNYGEVEKGKHALWALLEAAQAQVGVDYKARIEALRPHIKKLSSGPAAATEDKSFSTLLAPVTLGEKRLSPLEAAREYVDCMMPIPPQVPKFWMSPCLVSNGLYYCFINSAGVSAPKVVDPSYLKHWIENRPRDKHWHLPVTNITFRAAIAFAEWLGQLTASEVRLPKLKEWQRAASAGRSNWFKEEIDAGRVNYFKTAGHLHSVDAFHPNPYGIRDLIGEVFDLCSSDDDLSKPVIVGGCHHHTEEQLRASLKGEEVRSDKCLPHTGFRCVRSA
jgi:formylglycine-generating enzyme required for sulfatase activity